MEHKASKVVPVTELSGNSIPSSYAFFDHHQEDSADVVEFVDESIPIIDYSLLESEDLDVRMNMINQLRYACENWGFFMVINHKVPNNIMKGIVDKCDEFFNMSSDEKMKYEHKDVLHPIRYGTSYSPDVEDVHFWRDYLKVRVHPVFHSPSEPSGFSDVALEYSAQVWRVVNGLLKGVSVSLGLEEDAMESYMEDKKGQQVLIANYYPPCPQPDKAIGLPPHSDHGLLTLLVHNGVNGLQISRNGKWMPIKSSPDAFLVNVADQLEIITNGRYKSILHRVMVNNKVKRISVAVANGPSPNAMVCSLPQLINGDEVQAKYKPMTYRNYLQIQQSNRLVGKSGLDIVRV